MGCFEMNLHTSTCSSKKVTYNILDDLKVELTIEENPYSIPLEEFFVMAARMNKKRSFLFVSKVLGKHLPINPTLGMITGQLLAARYMEKVKGQRVEKCKDLVTQFQTQDNSYEMDCFIGHGHNPIIIGFAETATALGHSFFDSFSHADYFHTTREWLEGVDPAITFEEEHSHATSHRAYVDEALLENDREIILVDDEITTGKTAINIIESLHKKYKRTTYTVVSILDWRSKDNVQNFEKLEKELGIVIHTVSLLKGTFSLEGSLDSSRESTEFDSQVPDCHQNVSYHVISNAKRIKTNKENTIPYLKATGRFGLNSEQNKVASDWMKSVGEELGRLRIGKRTLVLGTGEFMHLPMKIASHMGDGVAFHSTTRSPIYPVQKENYGARNRFAFQNPEDPNIQNFVYNIMPNQYDELFLFFEREVERTALEEMLNELKKTKIQEIKIVYFSGRVGE